MPQEISIGTTPDIIHVVATMAMQMSIGSAGRVCAALLFSPARNAFRRNLPVIYVSTMASAVDDNSTAGA